MARTSFYALEMYTGPGGGRRADCFVYNQREHLAKVLGRAFRSHGTVGPSRWIVDMFVHHGMSVVIWVIQRGERVGVVDVEPLVGARLDDESQVSLAELRTTVLESERVTGLELDDEAMVAALPELERPLLRPGWSTVLPREAPGRDALRRSSYLTGALSRSAVDLRYGHQSFEGDGPPRYFVDPDPPSRGPLRDRLDGADGDAIVDVFERALVLGDTSLAGEALERLPGLSAERRVEAYARLDHACGQPGLGLVRAARFVSERGLRLEESPLSGAPWLGPLRSACRRDPGSIETLLRQVRATERGIAGRREAALAEQGSCEGPARLLTNLAALLPWPTRGELLGAACAHYYTDAALVERVRVEFQRVGARLRSLGAMSWSLLAIALERRDEVDEALAAWTRAREDSGQATIPKLALARLKGRAIGADLRAQWRRLPARGDELDRGLLAWLEHDATFAIASLGPPGEAVSRGASGPELSLNEVSIGAAVRHVKFGVGTVLAIRAGEAPKLVIDFEDGGRRSLLLRFVKLA